MGSGWRAPPHARQRASSRGYEVLRARGDAVRLPGPSEYRASRSQLAALSQRTTESSAARSAHGSVLTRRRRATTRRRRTGSSKRRNLIARMNLSPEPVTAALSPRQPWSRDCRLPSEGVSSSNRLLRHGRLRTSAGVSRTKAQRQTNGSLRAPNEPGRSAQGSLADGDISVGHVLDRSRLLLGPRDRNGTVRACSTARSAGARSRPWAVRASATSRQRVDRCLRAGAVGKGPKEV